MVWLAQALFFFALGIIVQYTFGHEVERWAHEGLTMVKTIPTWIEGDIQMSVQIS